LISMTTSRRREHSLFFRTQDPVPHVRSEREEFPEHY
jgi:hypothetical protein